MPATTGDTFAITMPIDFDEQQRPVLQIVRLDVGAADPADPGPVQSLERISTSTTYPD